MSIPASPMPRVGIIINGLPFVAEAASGTQLIDVRGRQAIAATGPGEVISVVTTPVDTELADLAASKRRVKAAAAGPWTPRAERPSARQAAIRQAAREYHAATWQAGYSQARAEFDRMPLDQRITEDDVPGVIEMVLSRVLANPELRESFQKAADAAAFGEEMLGAE